MTGSLSLIVSGSENVHGRTQVAGNPVARRAALPALLAQPPKECVQLTGRQLRQDADIVVGQRENQAAFRRLRRHSR